MRTVPAELVKTYEAAGWWTPDTIGDLLARGLAAAPDTQFRVHSAVRPWSGTFGEAELVARRLARSLRERGVGPGDVVAFQLPNWMEAAAVFWASAFLGAVVVPIVHFYGRKEVGYILTSVRPKVFATMHRQRQGAEVRPARGHHRSPSATWREVRLVFKEFVASGDSHIIEPVDLFKTRLPRHLRERALWEEEFTLDEPMVKGGHTQFKKLHTIGFDGWTISKYRQFGGPTPDGEPEHILRDMDLDGVDASVMFPNLSLFVLFTDDHELSMAHARVYNDYIAERYLAHKARMRPTAVIPLTGIPDAVAEIERTARMGLGAILVPEIPPVPYWSRQYDPVWAAAQAHGMPVFIHVATGGVKVKEEKSVTAKTVRALMTAVNMGKGQLTDEMVSSRTMGGGNTGAASPQRIIADLISGGACERFPDLHFNLVEFSAGWLVSYIGFMDRSWRTGTGQDPDWWLGFWDDDRPPHDQPAMGRLFAVNAKWPWPLKPSEYVRRQIHVQFADDPVAVKARHITGLSTIMWGNDYPHAEGTFRNSAECVAENFDGVPDEDRAAILGGTLAGIVGFDTSKKLCR